MKQLVYAKVALDCPDSMPYFFKRLREFVGDFIIERQSISESIQGVIRLSFWWDTDFKEGEDRQVSIQAGWEGNDWKFLSVEK